MESTNLSQALGRKVAVVKVVNMHEAKPNLSRLVGEELIDSGAPLYFSVPSLWEMTIKSAMGLSLLTADPEVVQYGDPVIDIS